MFLLINEYTYIGLHTVQRENNLVTKRQSFEVAQLPLWRVKDTAHEMFRKVTADNDFLCLSVCLSLSLSVCVCLCLSFSLGATRRLCVYYIMFNQTKDGQTYHDSSTNTNYAIITEYKLREHKVLNHYGSGGRIEMGVVVGI